MRNKVNKIVNYYDMKQIRLAFVEIELFVLSNIKSGMSEISLKYCTIQFYEQVFMKSTESNEVE
jgi:hypothetical protein